MKKNLIVGELTAKGKKFCIVVSRFNSLLSESLLNGALDCLERHSAESVDVIKVPGAFEIPLAAEKMASSGKYDAVIALGAVIRGSTSHYDYVCNEV